MRIGFTRIGPPLVFCEWQFHREDGTASRLGVYTRLAPEPVHTLLDAEQAQPLHLPDIKALSVVLDDEYQAILLLFHADAHSGRVRMACTVVQGFLNNSINTGLILVRKIVGVEFRDDAH